MASIDMWGESKIDNQLNTGRFLKSLFIENWHDVLLVDALNDRAFTYEEFFQSILWYKKRFEQLGIKKDDVICLLMANSLDLATLYFTSLLMQLVVVPIDVNKSRYEIEEILSYVDYKALVCNVPEIDFVPDKIDVGQLKEPVCESNCIDIQSLDAFDSVDYDKLFLITFTSGSTGAPKGVMHSFSNLFQSAIAFRDRFGFGKETIFYHNLPMTYMAGILNLIVLPLISDSKIVIGERFSIMNIMRFWDMPKKYSVNTFWFIPTIISLLLKLDRGTSGIEYSKNVKITGCVGTAPLNYQAKCAFEDKYQLPLYESYGLSETLFVATNFPGHQQVKGSVGKLLEGVELTFCDDSEILIGVPWMFLGYSNVKTEDFTEEGKFSSGDFGTLIEDNSLAITGRKKDLVIRGGINISPKRIEDFINEFDIFEENVILGMEDINLGEKIVCFFVPKLGQFGDDKKKELSREVVVKLGRDYQIDEFVTLNEIPKNTNGKVDKLQLRALIQS